MGSSVNQPILEARWLFIIGKLMSISELIISCTVYALVVALATFGVLFLAVRDLNGVFSNLPLILLLVGGLGLVVGGALASFSSTVGKIGESVLHSKPWDARRQKEAEAQAKTWITTGALLVLLGFLASAF